MHGGSVLENAGIEIADHYTARDIVVVAEKAVGGELLQAGAGIYDHGALHYRRFVAKGEAFAGQILNAADRTML